MSDAPHTDPRTERETEIASDELSERELVALVDGRRDLASDATRARVDDDDDLGAALEALRDERDALSMALKRAQPELGGLDGDDVADLVSRAMAKADAPDVIRISPRSLGWGSALGGLAVLSSAIAWIAFQDRLTAPISHASENVRLAWSLGATFDRIVGLVPGGWTSLAAVALGVGAVLLACLRWLEHGKRIALPAAGALVVLSLLGAGRAQAYDVEGRWPSPDPRVDVDIEAQPLPVALEAATRSVGLGLVYGIDDTHRVTLHAHGVPLREVLDAMLGSTPAVVRHTGHMLVISAPAEGARRTTEGTTEGVGPLRIPAALQTSGAAEAVPAPASEPRVGPLRIPAALQRDEPERTEISRDAWGEEPATPLAPAAPVAPVAPAVPVAPAAPIVAPAVVVPAQAVPPSPAGRIEDIVTFGGDATVPAGHDVRDVVTMGGDAQVDGRAFGNVVTMGGDADIAGIVVGNVATMGGDIHIRRSGMVFGRLETMGGEVLHEGGGASSGVALSVPGSIDMQSWQPPEAPEGSGFVAAVVESAEAGLRYALLFLGALLFAFFAPERFGRLHTAVRKAPLRSIAGGAVALIAGALLTFVLIITIIGIPVAFVLGLTVFVAACAGLATVGHLVGQALPVRALEGRPVWRLGAGILALFVVTRVPFFGWLAFLLALAIGLGAVVLTRFGKNEVDVDP